MKTLLTINPGAAFEELCSLFLADSIVQQKALHEPWIIKSPVFPPFQLHNKGFNVVIMWCKALRTGRS